MLDTLARLIPSAELRRPGETVTEESAKITQRRISFALFYAVPVVTVFSQNFAWGVASGNQLYVCMFIVDVLLPQAVIYAMFCGMLIYGAKLTIAAMTIAVGCLTAYRFLPPALSRFMGL